MAAVTPVDMGHPSQSRARSSGSRDEALARGSRWRPLAPKPERWRYDALELQTADDEAMSRPAGPISQRMINAPNEIERLTDRRASVASGPETRSIYAGVTRQDAQVGG